MEHVSLFLCGGFCVGCRLYLRTMCILQTMDLKKTYGQGAGLARALSNDRKNAVIAGVFIRCAAVQLRLSAPLEAIRSE